MAVVNVSSTEITNLDAKPVVWNNTIVQFGGRYSSASNAAFAASDATSIARVLRVHSDARITRLEFASDDLGTGGTVDIGLYQTNGNGGAVVDADFFASAVDTDSAAVARTDVTYESGVVTITNQNKPLWEQLGLSEDSQRQYDVVVTRNTAQATGNVALWLEYVRN